MLYGFRVFVSPACVSHDWIFPTSRFWEYEQRDEKSCRKLGIGHEGAAKPIAYQIGDTLYLHPDIYEQLKHKLPEPSKPDPLGGLKYLGPRHIVANYY